MVCIYTLSHVEVCPQRSCQWGFSVNVTFVLGACSELKFNFSLEKEVFFPRRADADVFVTFYAIKLKVM